MILVDTHTHLYLDNFDTDQHQVIKSAIDSGVHYMLLPNIDSYSIQAMKKLNASFPINCPMMMGLHPTSVKEDYETELALVENELNTGKYIAVGEIGIDLYWDKTFASQQQDAFRRQLVMAKKYGLPVSIHTRDAFDEILKIVKEEQNGGLKGVFHCFTGTIEQAGQVLETGFNLGIGGVLTFKKASLQEVVQAIPIGKIVIETDAPFLAPAPHRGKRNESAYLMLVAEKLAELKRMPVGEVAEITSATAMNIFNLKK